MRKSLVILAIFALHVAAAGAQPAPLASLRVEQSAEEACPDERAIRAEVDRRLGHTAFSESASRAIVVRYRPSSRGRRRARITVQESTSAASVREIVQDGPDCAALFDAVALAVALVIDPDAALRPLTTLPAAPSTPTVASTCPEAPARVCPECAICSPPAPPSAPPPAPPRRRPLPPAWIAVVGGVVLGVLPAPALGLGFTASVPFRAHLSFDLGASYLPPVGTRDGAASIGWTVARAGACLDTTPSWAQVGGCADALVGALHLAALQLQPVAPGDRAWIGTAAEVHARLLPGNRWVLSVQARAIVPLLTWAPRVEGASSPSFSPPPVAFEADLAVGLRLP